ncbi:MAG TPA: hypothetical protein VG758_22645 [Hyphomicrobiaceae bacterium]|jgi:hypothetical protein|nr:hypothetical protein [Hyphomicrobiaceae bacterium]
MTNLWKSIVRFVSERLNGGGSGHATPELARAASEPSEPAATRKDTGATEAPPAGPMHARQAPIYADHDPHLMVQPHEAVNEPGEVVAGGTGEGLTQALLAGRTQQIPADVETGPRVSVQKLREWAPEPARDRSSAAPAEPVQAGCLPRGTAGLEEKIVKAYQWGQSKFVGGVTELTLLTPITPGPIPGQRRTYEERLRQELGSIQRRVDRGLNTPISVIPTIHFAGWLILRPEQYLQSAVFPRAAPPSLDPYAPAYQEPTHDYRFRTWLFFTSYFDGDLKDYLREFSNFLGKDVDRVWGNCEGYPQGGSLDFEAFWQYAKRYQIQTDAFFNAYPGLSVPKIYQLKVFKERFAAFVRATRNPDGRSVEGVGDLLDRFIIENQAYTADFPAMGGTYDKEQSNRTADLRKS